MAKAVIQANIQSANGSVIVAPNASISITDAGSGLPVTLWEERAGTTPTANPTTADTNGFFRVYANPGRVNIEATYGGNVQTFMDVPIFEEGTGSPDGIITIDFSSDADLTLSSTQAANRFIVLTDTGVVLTTARNVIFPADAREWVVFNNTAQTQTAKTSAGTGIPITASNQMRVYGDETNIEKALIGDADFRSITTLPPDTGGTSTAYTVTLGTAGFTADRVYSINFHTAGTATGATINPDGAGAVTLKDRNGNAVIPPAGVARIWYDGTDARLLDIASVLTHETAIATTSGTSHDFTIPSWAKKVTITTSGVTRGGTSPIIFQIGDSGGIETTSYIGSATSISSAAQGVQNNSTGFHIGGDASVVNTAVFTGTAILSIHDESANEWNLAYAGGRSDTANAQYSSGSKVLSGKLTTVRLTTVGGTDTFTAGSFNVMYE